jgi:hypothetical protein
VRRLVVDADCILHGTRPRMYDGRGRLIGNDEPLSLSDAA